jgi:hypothetical protein
LGVDQRGQQHAYIYGYWGIGRARSLGKLEWPRENADATVVLKSMAFGQWDSFLVFQPFNHGILFQEGS